MTNTGDLDIVQAIRNLVTEYLGLDDSHCYIYNGKWKRINDKDLYLVVGLNGDDVVANNLSYYRENGSLYSNSGVISCSNFYFDFFSYTTEARKRRLEIVSFLSSDMLEYYQERCAFRVAKHPYRLHDLSVQEGNKILNRYRIDFTVIHSENYSREVPYYDKLGARRVYIND